MKHIIILILAITSVNLACNAQRLFEDASKLNGVSTVYMGSQLMSSIGSELRPAGYGINGDFVHEVRQIEIINAESNITEVRGKCQAILDKLNLELILETKDEDDLCLIYISTPVKDEYSDQLFIINEDGFEYELLYISGKIHIPTLLSRYANISIH
ncbi:MAG: DUF4252 domain-containing protein [Odoribacter sp.]|nr:DUF4252 domain-containing protein [Odoribacter sp.]